jgi:hypothetical protein
MSQNRRDVRQQGRRLALVIAGTGVLWVLANMLGAEYGWPNRVRALFDLLALAAFGAALWMAIGLWRARRD